VTSTYLSMKHHLFYIFLFFVGVNIKVQGQQVLSTYNSESVKIPFQSPSALFYMARFDIYEPIAVERIRIQMDGTGQGKIGVFGQEGGSPFAEVEHDLIEPISFKKNNNGVEFIEIILPKPLKLTGNQFFIKMDIAGSALRIMRDVTPLDPSCVSSNGGNFLPSILAVNGNHPFYDHVWSVMSTPFVVDVYYQSIYPEEEILFEDVTEKLGFPMNLSSRTIAWGDYDNDGFLDVLISGRLFKNLKGDSFINVTQELGLNGNARGNSFVDINNDGLLDIVIFHATNYLFVNNGDGTFTQHTLDIPEFPSLSSFSFADLNNDGYPDLFVGQLWGAYPVPLPNYLFFNDKNLGFTDETNRIYPQYNGTDNFPTETLCEPNNSNTFLSGRNRNRRSRGSQFVDIDNDGDLDLYVTNYFLERDELYENDGQGNFTPIVNRTNIDINQSEGSSHGTGVDWADYDNDGDMDLLLPRLAHPWGIQRLNHQPTYIYRNENPENFKFEALTPDDSGIEYEETHAGACWGDFNNDGLQDFVITTFYGCRFISLYQQNSDHTFHKITHQSGLGRIASGNDAVFADFDNDGKLDLCVGLDNRFRIYKNVSKIDHKNYVKFDLKGIESNVNAIGGRVVIETNEGTYTQEISCGRGQMMQKPSQLFYGLNKSSIINNVKVVWPSGKVIEYGRMHSNTTYTLNEDGQIEGGKKVEELKVYPNPTTGILKFNDIVDEVSVFNLSGQFLLKKSDIIELHLNDYQFIPGFYILQIQYGDEIIKQKMVLLNH